MVMACLKCEPDINDFLQTHNSNFENLSEDFLKIEVKEPLSHDRTHRMVQVSSHRSFRHAYRMEIC